MDELKVEKVFRDEYGKAIRWELSDGNEYNLKQMTDLIDIGRLPGWMYSKNQAGYYIKTKPDGIKSNNMNYPNY